MSILLLTLALNYTTVNGYTLKITNLLSQIVYTTPINQPQTIVNLSTWTDNEIYFGLFN
jgi:hypothetical protein